MRGRLVTLALAAVCVLCSVALATGLRDERDLRLANQQAQAGQLARAERTAAGVTDGITRARALRVIAYTRFLRRDPEGFLPAARRALREAPADWELRRDYALIIAVRGNRDAAQTQMNLALAANPKMELPFGFVRRRSGQRP